MSDERCTECGEATGRAGVHDDSNYLDSGDGPYCDECFSSRHIGELEDRIADLDREIEQLRSQAVQSPVIHWTQDQDEDGPSKEWYAQPEHPREPVLTVTGGIICRDRYAPDNVVPGAEVMITATDDDDDEVVVAHVQVPLTDGIEGNCSICGGGALVLGADGEPMDCPWCVEGASVVDEAKEIAAALYWSWIRSAGPRGGCCGNEIELEMFSPPQIGFLRGVGVRVDPHTNGDGTHNQAVFNDRAAKAEKRLQTLRTMLKEANEGWERECDRTRS